MPNVRTGTVPYLSYVIGSNKSRGLTKVMRQEVLPTVGGSEKYMAKGIDTGSANGLGPIAQSITPGYVQMYMIVFF